MTDSAPRRTRNFRSGDHWFSYNLTCSAHCPSRIVVGDCAAVTETAAVTVGAASSGDGAKTCCACGVRARTALSNADRSVASTKICCGRVCDESVAKYGTATRVFTCSSCAPTLEKMEIVVMPKTSRMYSRSPFSTPASDKKVLSSALATIEMR